MNVTEAIIYFSKLVGHFIEYQGRQHSLHIYWLADWLDCLYWFEGIVPVLTGEESRDAGRVVAINQADTGIGSAIWRKTLFMNYTLGVT